MYLPETKDELIDLLFTEEVDPTLIDTRLITDMSQLFFYQSPFNGDISGWDTSSVTNSTDMFTGANAMEEANKPTF